MCGSKEVPDASNYNWRNTISKIGLLCIGIASGALRAARLADLTSDGPMHYYIGLLLASWDEVLADQSLDGATALSLLLAATGVR